MFRRFAVTALALLAFCCSAGAQTQRVQITVLSTTDLHGNLLPIDYYTNQPDQRGLGKIAASPENIAADIDAAHEVLGEALQTALRAAGVPNGYELLKDFTRGAQVDAAGLAAFIDKLPLPAADRARLKALSPAQYTGLAEQLARSI